MRPAIFIMFALLLAFPRNSSAQEREDIQSDEWIKIRAERMAERTAEEYGLNDKEKKKLQEANEILLQKESERRDSRYRYDRRSNLPSGRYERDNSRIDGYARHCDRNVKDICHDRYGCCDRPRRHHEERCCHY